MLTLSLLSDGQLLVLPNNSMHRGVWVLSLEKDSAQRCERAKRMWSCEPRESSRLAFACCPPTSASGKNLRADAQGSSCLPACGWYFRPGRRTRTVVDGARSSLVEAQVECLAQGMRLCSRGELSLGKSGSRSAGCTFTQHQRYAPVWTRSPCTSLASRGALEEPMSEEERSNTTTLTLTELSHAKKTCPNAPFATCGGVHFTGERCCPNGSTCKTSSLEPG
jgi:hypothetical protein